MFLSIFTVPILAATYLWVPETHHWFVFQKLKAKNQHIAVVETNAEKSPQSIEQASVVPAVVDVDDPEVEEPKMESVLTSLLLLFDKDLGPYYILNGFAFCSMFTSLTLLPIYIGSSPYNLNSGISGLCYLPVGVAFILGSIAGGASSDYAAHRFQGSKAGRLIIPLILSISCPLGIIGKSSNHCVGTRMLRSLSPSLLCLFL